MTGRSSTGDGAGQVSGDAAIRAEILALAERLAREPERPGGDAAEPVSMPLIRQWCAAMGDRNAIYTETEAAAAVHGGPVAPPAMLQVWTMRGLGEKPAGTQAGEEILSALRAAGYTGVVATNCEHSYDRYLRPGELLRFTLRLGEVTGPKRTALGEGYFVTRHITWYSGGERVGRMMFRMLLFRPPGDSGRVATGGGQPSAGRQPPEPGSVPGAGSGQGGLTPPAMNADTRFFWDGAKAGELRIQRCRRCAALRHPPGPVCPRCHSTDHDYVVACGRGEVFSYVVHHHPPVPGRKAPFVVAVVQLPEGVRVTGNILGIPPGEVRIGMPVEVVFEHAGDGLVLPQWKSAAPNVLPELVVPLTTTLVVTTALATRDFTALHHDSAAARAQGARDVFLNILTTMGLVERFVTDWTGPRAVLESIAMRLGVPAYAGDTLTLSGLVTGCGDDGVAAIAVRGVCGLGDHVTATVRLRLDGTPGEPGGGPAR